MAKCIRLKRKDTRVCAGSLNRRIEIFERVLTPPQDPTASFVDYEETFNLVAAVWAMIDDFKGDVIFNEISIDNQPTHNIYIRFIPNTIITQENWLVFDTVRFNILRVDVMDELNKFIKLECVVRGADTKDASKA